MNVPEKWRDYDCGDYFRSALAEHGWWNNSGQCWLVKSAQHVRLDSSLEFLIIGGPGVDGITWGYRMGRSGVWAHYPIENEFVWVAATASDLREGYSSGRIKV